MTTISIAEVEAAARDARETRESAGGQSISRALYACQECGRRFRGHRSAERAVNNGCPRCGGSDIDLA